MRTALTTIAFGVSITVIFCMAAAFGILFCLYGKYKLRSIESGLEDGTLLPQLENEYEREAEPDETAYHWLQRKNDSGKKLRAVTDVVFGFLIVLLLLVSAVAVAFRAQGDQFFLGNTSYFTILTGSMEEKNAGNPYYSRLPDDGQIKQFSLIGIKKVKESELNLYDVVAFEYDEVVYVHRIVRIVEKDGVKLYTTMGDANTGSMSAEVNMTFDKIIGRYNGFQNFGLGVAISYLESNIGIISLVFALLMLSVISFSEGRIDKRYAERIAELAVLLDEGDSLEVNTGAHPIVPKLEELPGGDLYRGDGNGTGGNGNA